MRSREDLQRPGATKPLTTLRRARNGDWLSRKAVPADVGLAYRAAHGAAQEERFRRDGSIASERVKQELREWDATISCRINSLRGVSNGEGQCLTQREAHGLAADAPDAGDLATTAPGTLSNC
jgi:hypothetical protein